jgi:hypothetical protein
MRCGVQRACAVRLTSHTGKKGASMSEHAKEIEPKIQKIQAQLKKLTSDNHSERLIQIIHRPPWTTPREVEFVHAMLDSVSNQLDAAHREYDTLTTIADKIGR